MSDVFPHTPFGLDPAGAAAAHGPGQSKAHAEGLHGPGPQASGQAESAGLGTTICGCGSNIGKHGALVGLEPGTKTCGRLVV